jgi:hypothetical protein
MIRLNTIILIILFSSFVSGCGQKGALRQAEKRNLDIDKPYKKQINNSPSRSNTTTLDLSSTENKSVQ